MYPHVMQQRAFLLARKREREARLGGRPGGSRGGGGHGSDGEGYGGEDDEYDSEDSFIDDDESGDWRRHLRSLTGEGAREDRACVCSCAGGKRLAAG